MSKAHRSAVPLVLSEADVRFPNGRFQSYRVIGVDDVTLAGAPHLIDGSPPTVMYTTDAVIVDSGGTSGKLQTPILVTDQWPHDGPNLDGQTRELLQGNRLV